MSLYSELFYTVEGIQQFSEAEIISTMLKVEAALAQSQAHNGLFSSEIAHQITSCCTLENIDIGKLKKEIKLGANAAIPLVQQLTKRVKSINFEASKYVHLGATSQDIIDTATVLQIKKYISWIELKIDALLIELAKKTRKHQGSIMVGRTLFQHAKPITFGLKTGLWLESILRSKHRISEVKDRLLVIQLAGAVGAQNNSLTTAVCDHFAHILGLKYSNSWASERDNFNEFASKLGILCGSIGKIAKDISLLMQTEIAEVFEGAAEGKGGSSTMPHKRNPVTCASILANSTRVPHLVATMLSTMSQEHERSAGLWHAEWDVLTEIMQLTAGCLEKSIDLISGLEIVEKRMLANVEITQGLIFAENISLALASKLGKIQAHELIEKSCKTALAKGKHLKEILKESKVDLSNLEELFDPQYSIGNSIAIVDSILKKYQNEL